MGFNWKKFLLFGSISVVVAAVTINAFLTWLWRIPGVITVPLEEYDFIIVGAGTAGCVVAQRLAQHCNCSVLLIEAGGWLPWVTSIPLVVPTLQETNIDWAFKSVPQKYSQWGMNEQRSNWPRGKVLGGSSTINYLLHMWGAPSDFNNIAKEIKDSTWNFTQISRYFRKTESYTGTFNKDKLSKRGKKGVLPVTEPEGIPFTLLNALLSGAKELGLKNVDLNSEAETGIMISQRNVKNGERITPFHAYLQPVLGKYNISVLMNTFVTKVIFENKRAVGVESVNIITNEHTVVRSKKEVILCGGAIGSPHLLLLSGVGPKEQLRNFSIPLVADLPGVGKNLQDHLAYPMYFHLNSSVSMTTSKARTFKEIKKYFFDGKGYLSNTGVEAIARIALPGSNISDAEIFYIFLNVGSVDEMFKKGANMKDDVFMEAFPESSNTSKEGFFLLPTCAHPASRGVLRLSSKNWQMSPSIDPNYLSKREDVNCFIKAIKMGARLGSSKLLQGLGSRLQLPAFKKCVNHTQSLDNNDYLECLIRTIAMTSYHPIGTCAIGTNNNRDAVLDTEFRVRKLENLRVVDLSALSRLTSSTPHALAVVMAQKASNIIIKQHMTSIKMPVVNLEEN